MAIIKVKKIREMSAKEQQEKMQELHLEISKEIALAEIGGNVKNPGSIREMRKTIARIKTIQEENKRGGKS